MALTPQTPTTRNHTLNTRAVTSIILGAKYLFPEVSLP